MTGGEIVPIVTSIAKSAGGALEDDESVKQQLARMAESTPQMRGAAQDFATRTAIKQAILKKIYMKAAQWFRIGEEYFANDFATDFGERLDGIPEENLTEPKPNIAVPAMQALGYSLDEPELKNMYLNLLATATDNRVSDQAHPSFVEVIRQLTGEEARILNMILERHTELPIARMIVNIPSGGYLTVAQHVIDLRDLSSGTPALNPSVPVWIDNWIRLGLVSVDYMQHLVAPSRYEWVEQRPEYESARKQAEAWQSDSSASPESGQFAADYTKGLLAVTHFGKRFATAVGARQTPA